jgi:hypothetical protein
MKGVINGIGKICNKKRSSKKLKNCRILHEELVLQEGLKSNRGEILRAGSQGMGSRRGGA